MYGVLQTSITSADWKMQSVPIDDSSFGFENFTGNVVPALPLKLRLNANCKQRTEGDNACNSDIDETFNIDYLHDFVRHKRAVWKKALMQ